MLLAVSLLCLPAMAENEIPTYGSYPDNRQYHYNQIQLLKDPEERIVVYFHGKVYNDLAEPLVGAKIQFWHTDRRGIYNHPQDLQSRGNPELLEDFTYFGTSESDENGDFQFTTYRPGIYTGRPMTHIHYKVFSQDDNETLTERLTSQFYFQDENHQQYGPMMQLNLVPLDQKTTESGNRIRYFETHKLIVVDMGLNGNTTLTPSQQEGPFYPLVDFFDVGNDLTNNTSMHTAWSSAPGSGARDATPLAVTCVALLSLLGWTMVDI